MSINHTHLLAGSSKERSPGTARESLLLRVSQAEIRVLTELCSFQSLWERIYLLAYFSYWPIQFLWVAKKNEVPVYIIAVH